MNVTLRLTEALYRQLDGHFREPGVYHERLGYSFARAVYAGDEVQTIIAAEAPILLAEDCYLAQSSGHVSLNPEVLNSILVRFARSDADVLVNVHSHPFSAGGTDFSSIDTRDEETFNTYVRERFEPMLEQHPDIGRPRKVVNLALVFDQSGLAARYIDRNGRFRDIDRVEVIGTVAKRIVPNNVVERKRQLSRQYLRQRDFVTPEQQEYLATTRVAVVGAGGLGSILAESLLRIGCRRFVLVDPDRLEEHNLNRWQGGSPADIGKLKVDVLAGRIGVMSGYTAEVETVPLSVLDPDAVPQLARADVLFGCLDNHLARYFLNRFSALFVVPYLDAGVNITVQGGVDFQHRYFGVIPGLTACAECTSYELIDQAEVNRALMDEVTAAERQRAGYVEDRPEITAAASAYPLNQGAAGVLATEFLNWACDFRSFATASASFWATNHVQRSDRANHPEGPDPDCVVCSYLLGAGTHAELPRPPTPGRTSRLLAETRQLIVSASPRAMKGEKSWPSVRPSKSTESTASSHRTRGCRTSPRRRRKASSPRTDK